MFKYKHTTKVPPETTSAEIMKVLCLLGATDISHEIIDGELVGMKFAVAFDDGKRLCYQMPIRWQAIFECWKAEKQKGDTWRLRKGWEDTLAKQAKWTAWRIALDWLKVQMSFVQTGARDAREVFLSDLIVNADGETLGQLVMAGKLPKLLEQRQ